MLKAKVTNQELRNGYFVIAISYCGARNILNFAGARFYNYGVYGWNYDVYELDYNLAICTGYRPVKSIPEKINKEAAEIIYKYDKKAGAIRSGNYKSFANYRRAIERLYNKMVAELKAVVNYTTVYGK